MNSSSSSTSIEDQVVGPFQAYSPANKHSSLRPIKATQLSDGHTIISPTLIHEINARNENMVEEITNTQNVVINVVKPSKNRSREEDVSESFVKKFNAHIGNKDNNKKAYRLIRKMQRLGGLLSPRKNQEVQIDIPSARLGLSYLAGLNDPVLKMKALDNLLHLLQNDPLEKETSIHLVSLSINLMHQMNRELMQAETLDVQIKITQVYSKVAELLQRHYSKKHINAITKELKTELINTIKALEAINSLEDQKLQFYTKLALEGVRRLVDDRKELFDIIERFFHGCAAIYSLGSYDISTGIQEFINTFKDLDPHFSGSWYNGVLILNEFVKVAKSDPKKLQCIQILFREKYKKFNWKFTYAALEAFAELSLKGETEKIRETAFQGIKALGLDCPGLVAFAGTKELSRQIDLKPMVHLKKPRRKNPNVIIRQSCAEHLAKIALESKDDGIRRKAKILLIQRLHLEKDKNICEYLRTNVPQTKDEQAVWIKTIN